MDLACGSGRHSRYLNKRGFEVAGLDYSKESLRRAKAFETPTLRFFWHDMRTPFHQNDFDYVVNLFTSFGYFETFEEHTKTLRMAGRCVKAGGKLIIDFLNCRKAIDNLVASEEKEIGKVMFRIRRHFDGTFIRKHIEVIDRGRTSRFEERVMALDKHALVHMMKSSDFEVLDEFGDYRLGEFDPITSQRLILVCGYKGKSDKPRSIPRVPWGVSQE